MYGLIAGDIAGDPKEVVEILAFKSKVDTANLRYQRRIAIMDPNVPLFESTASYTDDTATTLGILKSELDNTDYESTLRSYCMGELNLGLDKYGRSRFGSGFTSWITTGEPNNSYGNGSAMRISSIGFLNDDIEVIKEKTKRATIISHNHPESILCAEAISTSIYYLRQGYSKSEIKDYIVNNYFPLDYDIEDLRYNYVFTSKAITSVPIAVYAFLISNSFENAIRLALSCGGDSDTIAAITGSLAEAYYGVPDHIVKEVRSRLNESQLELLDRAYQKIKPKIKERK